MVPRRLLAAVALSLLAAGCLDDTPETSDAAAPVVEAVTPVAPQGFTQTGAIEPSLYNPMGYCQDFHKCFEFEFTVGENWTEDMDSQVSMDAQLSWGLAANNLDLVLYKGEKEIDADYANVGTTASIRHELDAGDYRILIDPYDAVGVDEFELIVTFELVDDL